MRNKPRSVAPTRKFTDLGTEPTSSTTVMCKASGRVIEPKNGRNLVHCTAALFRSDGEQQFSSDLLLLRSLLFEFGDSKRHGLCLLQSESAGDRHVLGGATTLGS